MVLSRASWTCVTDAGTCALVLWLLAILSSFKGSRRSLTSALAQRTLPTWRRRRRTRCMPSSSRVSLRDRSSSTTCKHGAKPDRRAGEQARAPRSVIESIQWGVIPLSLVSETGVECKSGGARIVKQRAPHTVGGDYMRYSRIFANLRACRVLQLPKCCLKWTRCAREGFSWLVGGLPRPISSVAFSLSPCASLALCLSSSFYLALCLSLSICFPLYIFLRLSVSSCLSLFSSVPLSPHHLLLQSVGWRVEGVGTAAAHTATGVSH